MNAHIFNLETHYDEVCGWWAFYGWPRAEKGALSNFGLIMEDRGVFLCAGWLYLTNSDFYLVEWLVSNPHAPLKKRTEGLEYLVALLVKEAEGFGKKLGFTSVSSRGLIRMLKRQGFAVGDINMTNLVRVSK